MAVEDIGLADPQALVVANAAKEAFDFLGSPEGELALAQADGLHGDGAEIECQLRCLQSRDARRQGARLAVAAQTILNAPTKLMEEEGYGSDYLYDHDQPEAFSGQNYFPDEFKRRPQYYDPPERGFEREIKNVSAIGPSFARSAIAVLSQ